MSDTNQLSKVVVYQVITRLFGNTKTTNKKWGTIEENGVGKFSDFSNTALSAIKNLGVTHIWFTGVLHHALIRDYTSYGISNDDPNIVKGRAGSPYAIKDYYNVNPDLAVNPANRLQEFKTLIKRTQDAGLKVIIDLVPNHVARKYESVSAPHGIEDFGANDNTNYEYEKYNNFYYIPQQQFIKPEWLDGYTPLNGEDNTGYDKHYENPAKWTGNGSREAQPHFYDWYETVKINFGIRPDGSKDFDELPAGYENKDCEEHYNFWQDKDIPDSWKKFKHIALYWIELGVDGFRYDMAELVPVEFWSYMNSSIKMANPNAFILAEVYQPHLYREYLNIGKMDYLYDKVDLYDTLKLIIQGHGSTDSIVEIQNKFVDIEHQMLHFLENHDEQRIASPAFAGDAKKGKPAMVVSATISSSPTMIYFGQEVGEPAADDAGFGSSSRTTIFDYWGVPNHQRWMNNGKFDGGQLSADEKELFSFYKTLLNLTLTRPALSGNYREIHYYNRHNTEWYNDNVFSFVRWANNERIIVVTNFNSYNDYGFELQVPAEIVKIWGLRDGVYALTDQLNNKTVLTFNITNNIGKVRIDIEALGSYILKLG